MAVARANKSTNIPGNYCVPISSAKNHPRAKLNHQQCELLKKIRGNVAEHGLEKSKANPIFGQICGHPPRNFARESAFG
jgi:hypothetical protein